MPLQHARLCRVLSRIQLDLILRTGLAPGAAHLGHHPCQDSATGFIIAALRSICSMATSGFLVREINLICDSSNNETALRRLMQHSPEMLSSRGRDRIDTYASAPWRSLRSVTRAIAGERFERR